MVHRHIRKDFAHVVAPNLYYRVLEMEKTIEGHEAAMREARELLFDIPGNRAARAFQAIEARLKEKP